MPDWLGVEAESRAWRAYHGLHEADSDPQLAAVLRRAVAHGETEARHSIGVTLGMDAHQPAISQAEIVAHVAWLEERSRTQGIVAGIRSAAPQVPIFGVRAALVTADAIERGEVRYQVHLERDEESGWWIVTVPSVPGCLTQAPTSEDVVPRIREALSLFVDDAETAPLELCYADDEP